ncbi:MAG: sugar kinase [Chloroflexota bacterium]
MSSFDVLTFGETMVRLTPPNLQQIEQTTTFDVEIGGSESNTAVGLARLGTKTAWLSGLPQNPLGRMVDGVLRRYGVDTSPVIWKENGRLGLYFYEEGQRPRGSRVFYDREQSVFSQLSPADISGELFQSAEPKHLHFSGISLALSESCRQTAAHLLYLAQSANWTTSFDLNYRSKLWEVEEAREVCEPFLSKSTVIFMPIRDAISFFELYDLDGPDSIIKRLTELFPTQIIVLTLGSAGAIGMVPNMPPLKQKAFPIDEVGRLGAGDAFNAGFLYGYLQTSETQEDRVKQGLLWGTGMAAMKYSILGDLPVVEKTAVETLISANGHQPPALNR